MLLFSIYYIISHPPQRISHRYEWTIQISIIFVLQIEPYENHFHWTKNETILIRLHQHELLILRWSGDNALNLFTAKPKVSLVKSSSDICAVIFRMYERQALNNGHVVHLKCEILCIQWIGKSSISSILHFSLKFVRIRRHIFNLWFLFFIFHEKSIEMNERKLFTKHAYIIRPSWIQFIRSKSKNQKKWER